MKKIAFLVISTAFTLTSCSPETEIKLRESGDEKMTYYASEKYGYSIEILEHLGGQYIQYVVRLNGNGEVMYIYKTPIINKEEPISAGPTWYLVSDTTDTMYGAKFFDREILGYYDSRATNFIRSNNYKGKQSPYLKEEKVMFVEVVKLMREKRQAFISFDTSHTFFWYKYDIQ